MMNRLHAWCTLFLLMSCLYPWAAQAQRFSVQKNTGCAPLSVNIVVNAPAKCDGSNPCSMNFGDGGGFQAMTFSHTYTQPGTYTVEVVFQSLGSDEIQVVVSPNKKPSFDIYTCGGSQVQVKVTDTQYANYLINFNDGTPEISRSANSTATHTYVATGPQNISVRGQLVGGDDNCTDSTRQVVVVNNLPTPTLSRLEVLDDAQVKMDFTPVQDIQYKHEIAVSNNTTFQQLPRLYNTSTVTTGSLKTNNTFYCFRLGAFDPCNNTTAYGNTVCSVDLDAAAQNNLNALTWNTSATGITGYTISRTPGTTLNAAPPQTSLNDPNVVCGQVYTYQLTASYVPGIESISQSKTVTAISTDVPKSIRDISAAVTGSQGVTLTWQPDPAFIPDTYTVTRITNGNFTKLPAVNTPAYTDDAFVPADNICYKVDYKDICGRTSAPDGITACPVRLSGALQANNHIVLDWTAYTGWQLGVVRYIVDKYDDQGQLLDSFDVGTALTLTDDADDINHQAYRFVVRALANDNTLSPSVSNEIRIIKEPNLFYPSAFTPNGDGLNDEFKVFAQFTEQFELKIFNRWGELMFLSDDFNQGWNGTYKGSLMPEGTYVFRARLTDKLGRVFNRSGTVLLLKKQP